MAGKRNAYSQAIVKKVEKYIDEFEKYEHAFPSETGLSEVLKINRATIKYWKTLKNPDDTLKHPEFADVLDRLLAKQELVCWWKGMRQEYNANLCKLLLAKHGYINESKQDLTSNGEGIVFNMNFSGKAKPGKK